MQEGEIAINTHDPTQLGWLVKTVDPDLNFISDLHPHGATCRTLLVEQAGVERILKVRILTSNVWDDTYFYYEINALKRVAERNLDNVTQLIGEYRSPRYHAILKTYAEGTPCNALDIDQLLKKSEFIQKLDALYMKLHLAGIAKIQFEPRKFVISPNDELTLVDLSTCVVNTETGVSIFSQEMRADSRFITRLEKAANRDA